jgi:hypothetical protein
MGTAAATSTKQVYQRSGIKQRWFTKMMRQIQIKAAGNRTFFRPQNVPTRTSAQEFSPSRPNIRIHDLADWRTLVYGLPAMTAKQREDVRHKGITNQYPSLHAEAVPTGYTVFDPARPEVVAVMSELQWELSKCRIALDGQGKLSLSRAPLQFGCSSTHWDDTYFTDRRRHSITPYPTAERAEAQQTIARNIKCLEKKDCHPSTGELPVRVPYTWESKCVPFEYRWRSEPVGGGWDVRPFAAYRKPSKSVRPDRSLWERKWTNSGEEWTVARPLPSDAELLMLPLSQRIGWRRRRPRESGWSKQVKCIKHPQ